MSLVKLSDYVARVLVQHGVKHVFMVTGGGAMHLDDSLGKTPGLKYICCHHEQACATAAESYTRLSGQIAAVCVTSGPGGLNALTGVFGAWTDSVPMIIISGQVRYDTTVRSTGFALRQLGDQEYDIVRSATPMTKYAVMVTNPCEIRYHLEKALYLAMIGRPGPCWLDIPLNIQGAVVDDTSLIPYDLREDISEVPPVPEGHLIVEIIQRIKRARHPVLMVGSAVRSSGSHQEFLQLVDLLKIPVVTAFNAHDIIESNHPLYCGRPGTVGDRAGNFAVQNSDLLLVIGCRLNIRQISYNWRAFARDAFKIIVDIDPVELQKPTIVPDLPIHSDARAFIQAMLAELPSNGLEEKTEWLGWCKTRVYRYPVVLNEYWQRDDLINPYCFVDRLGKLLPEGQIVVTGDGTACVCTYQAIMIKKDQRLFSNSGSAPMGYDLPAAVGACIASGGQKVVCLAGDGSIQMNLQELQTIVHYHLPIKIFIMNNGGYHSIRQTQTNFFGLPLVGCDPQSGVSFPDFEKLAYAYGIEFARCSKHADLDAAIQQTMAGDSPSICEVLLTPDQPFAPRLSSKRLPDGRMVSKPLEDLSPFLEREEFLQNMIIAPLPEE